MPDQAAEEREFLIWLRRVQKAAIVPLKWAILGTAVVFWSFSHPTQWPPPVDVFALFTIYLMCNLGESYFFWFSRVNLPQVHPFCIVSYCIDLVFVTLLTYFDSGKYRSPGNPSTDFYVFFFLLILRGFALFRAPRVNLLANTLIGLIFLASIFWQDASIFSYPPQSSMIRVIFVWLVILMSWFIVEIINRQKEEIMRGRENLIRSENMAVLGEIAAGVAHEINNPIGIISAYAEFLKKNAAPDDPRRDDFQAIYAEARRCENIVSELLDYARPSPGSKSPVDLRVLNDEVLDFLFRRPKGPEIKVERNYPGRFPLISIDSNQMKQALLNVFLNARESMAENGGALRVSLEADMERNVLRERIEDTGCGISEENLRKVFDPFFTTRRKGTGLGLPITRRIVEENGGRIKLSSIEGHGTTVEIVLPFEASFAT